MKIDLYSVVFLVKRKIDKYKVKIYFSIRSKKAFSIINWILGNPSALYSVKDLSEQLSLSPATTIYHCRKMVELGLLRKESEANHFMIEDNRKEYLIWIVNHHH